MRVMKSGSAELAPEFGLLAGRWAQYAGLGDMPFDAMWCVVAPGSRSEADCHPERELVVVVQGSADVHAGGRTEAAPAGSAVLLDTSEEHVLVNTSADDPLVFLSLYWLPEPDSGARPEATTEAVTPGAESAHVR